MLAVCIGFTAGALSGLLGIGGGVVVVPALVYLVHLNQRQAHGTSLFAIFCMAVAGAWYYSLHSKVDWAIALEMAFGGVFGAVLGAKLCAICSNQRLRQIFGVFLILVGLRMLTDWAFNGNSLEARHQILFANSFSDGLLIALLGVLTGVLSGLLGIGGGVIMIPALVFLVGLSQKVAQGISLAVIVPVSISGSAIHWAHGNVRFKVGAWVAIGGLLGSLAGAKMALGAEEVTLRALFGLVMLSFGAGMLKPRPAQKECAQGD